MALDLGPEPHRLERAHVVGVQLDRADRYIVRCSDGIDMTWDEWRAWGCRDLRHTAATPDARTGEAEGGRDAGPDGGGVDG